MLSLILAIAIILEQFFIAPIFPIIGNFGSIRPMIVFLDIPLPLPAIDIIPVSILFSLFYQIAPSAGLVREHPSISSGSRVWKGLTGWWLVLIFMVGGGFLFQYAADFLPRNISNGIDSFGVRADLTLPYPSGGLIHLHGSVVMLFFTAIGVLILRRRISVPAPVPVPVPVPVPATAAVAAPTRDLSSSRVSSRGTLISPSVNEMLAAQQEHARYQPPASPIHATPATATKPASTATTSAATVISTPPPAAAPKPSPKPKPAPVLATATATAPPPPPAGRSSYVQKPAPRPSTIITPEPPPTCRLTTPPPIAVVMPRPTPGTGKMHPCYVIGGLKPKKD